MRWLRYGLSLTACSLALVVGGCGPQVEPPAEITGVSSGETGGGATSYQDYGKQRSGPSRSPYSGQSGYPGAKGR
jgi:hypothetical protein